MSHEIIPFRPAGSPAIPATIARVELYGALLAPTRIATRRARPRVKDVAALGRYLGLEPAASLDLVVAGSPGQANTIALGFKADQLARQLAPNTINRRLSTLRRACRVARRLGLVDWSLDVELLRSEAYRDTAGPGLEGWRSILAVATRAAATGSPTSLRDLAIIRCLYDRGLRTIEVLPARPGRRRPRGEAAGGRRQGEARADLADDQRPDAGRDRRMDQGAGDRPRPADDPDRPGRQGVAGPAHPPGGLAGGPSAGQGGRADDPREAARDAPRGDDAVARPDRGRHPAGPAVHPPREA